MKMYQKLKILLLLPCLYAPAFAGNVTQYVNPFIGTGAIEGGLSGNNYPGATVPFGMVQLSPDTHEAPDWYNASGYDYNDTRIYGFSHTRLSGTGASDLIDVMLFPTCGNSVSSAFSHEEESASPGYYSVRLADEDILAELTATAHAGMHRYTFPDGAASRRIVLDLDHSANKGSWGRRIINSQIRLVGDNAVEGYRIITGWAKLRKVYFYMEFSQPVEYALLSDGDRSYENTSNIINGSALKAVLGFGGNEPVECRVGLSAVSSANARENLETETSGLSFDDCRHLADSLWNKELSAIEVTGDDERKQTFYTALYHTMVQPNVFSDVNGEYMRADYSTGRLDAGEKHYTTFSLWDTSRGAHPLYTIIRPDLAADFVNSMIRHCEAYGYLPIWQLWGQDNYCMIGNHAIPVVADAVLKELPGVDAERAYRAVLASSVNPHPNSPFDVWERFGYMPEDIQTQSVSITLEMAYDDWCVARMARKLGHDDDAGRFESRAMNFRNLYDPEAGFFCPRDSSGQWIRPFDALKYGANGGYPFTEGNAWQYYWYVPHAVDELVALTGGRKAFCDKLDTFFTLTDSSGEKNDNISGMIGQYAHGNEPSHHAAYLYVDGGKPERTQQLVHRIMTTLYNNSSSGYAGNDDCGEMSAWYVFSAMGLYPVNPASGEYYLGTPAFDRMEVRLPQGGSFLITASRPTAESCIVKKASLNGKQLKDLRLRHCDIVPGAHLHFELK